MKESSWRDALLQRNCSSPRNLPRTTAERFCVCFGLIIAPTASVAVDICFMWVQWSHRVLTANEGISCRGGILFFCHERL
jgi:hypothetical protein